MYRQEKTSFSNEVACPQIPPYVAAATVLSETRLQKVARRPPNATTPFARKHEIKINFH